MYACMAERVPGARILGTLPCPLPCRHEKGELQHEKGEQGPRGSALPPST